MLFDDSPEYWARRMVPPRAGSHQAYLMASLQVRVERAQHAQKEEASRRTAETTSSSGMKSFQEEEARKDFVFKIFALLAGQYLYILLVVVLFSSVKAMKEYAKSTPLMWQASGGISIFMYLLLSLVGPLRRIKLINFLLISTLVGLQALFFASLMVHFHLQVLIYSLAIETAIVVYITILSKFAPCDVVGCAMIFCVVATVLTVFGIVASLIWLLAKFSWTDFIVAGLLVTVVTLYLLFDTQVMMDNVGSKIKPDEFIKGNIHLHVDAVLLVIYLVVLLLRTCFSCCRKKKKLDNKQSSGNSV